MKLLISQPLDQTVADAWNKVDRAYMRAFLIVLGMNLLAFGFEMTNLTMHHDDVAYIFIQDDILGHYLGRFGLGWFYYHTQNAYYMPFLQMLQGIVVMTAYGMLVSHFWGLRKTLDIVLVSSILCVFPYMAQIYAYNVIMSALPVAHFLAAAAVVLSTRATLVHVATASVLYVGAFSIYQSVAANAATIFVIWILSNLLFKEEGAGMFARKAVKPAASALVSVIAGGAVYMAIVWSMDIDFGSYQAVGQAFSVKDGVSLSGAATEIINGTRAFVFWPENYFPEYLKRLQLVFILAAGIFCLWVPRGIVKKLAASGILLLALLAPRIMQLIHPQGNYHALTLTAYAVTVGGCVMIMVKARHITIRNLSIVLALVLIAGYILQCNWISTVNYLNTLAHYTTFTQILTRIKSLPEGQWDGEKVAVVGSYRKMYSGYPYKPATGVATMYMDSQHAARLAHLMRENMMFLEADQMSPRILDYAAKRAPWPHPESVGALDGVAVVVLSDDGIKRDRPGADGDSAGGESGLPEESLQ